MSSVSHHRLLLLLKTGLLLSLLNLLFPASCIDTSSSVAPKALLAEEKIRLGSTPPSCHSRCNTCNPCTAVQVPTLPSHSNSFHPSKPMVARPMDDPSYNKFSNYKPLGWKCRCRDHLYNP